MTTLIYDLLERSETLQANIPPLPSILYPLPHNGLPRQIAIRSAILSLTLQCDQLNRVMQSLKATDDILRLRQRQLRDVMSPIWVLPPEILMRIFTFVVLSDDSKAQYAATISHVSKPWRKLALAMPELWSRIEIPAFPQLPSTIDPQGIHLYRRRMHLDNWLRRASNSQLYLTLHDLDISRLIERTRSKLSERVVTLHVDGPPVEWDGFVTRPSRIPTFAKLEVLRITHRPEHHPLRQVPGISRLGAVAPRLQTLIIRGLHQETFHLDAEPCSNLTTIDLAHGTYTRTSHFFNLWQYAPRLERLSYTDCRLVGSAGPMVWMRSLRVLSMMWCHESVIMELLGRLEAPQLEVVILGTTITQEDVSRQFAHMLISTPLLHSLRIHAPRDFVKHVIHLVSHQHSLNPPPNEHTRSRVLPSLQNLDISVLPGYLHNSEVAVRDYARIKCEGHGEKESTQDGLHQEILIFAHEVMNGAKLRAECSAWSCGDSQIFDKQEL